MSIYLVESESVVDNIIEDTVLKITNDNLIYMELKNTKTNKCITQAKGLFISELISLTNKFKTVLPNDLIQRLEKREMDKVVLYKKNGIVDETTWRYEKPNDFWLTVYNHYHHNYLQGLKDDGVNFLAEKGIFTLSFSKKSKIKPNPMIDNSIILLLRLYLNYIDDEIKNISINVNTFLNVFEKTEYASGGVQYLFNIEKFKESNKH